jgi:hypothetical protein
MGVLDAHANHQKPQAPAIIRQCDHPEAASFITEAITEARSIPSRERQYEELLRRLRDRFIDKEMLRQRSLLQSLDDNSKEQHEALTQIMSLRQARSQPLSPLAGT